MNDRPGGWRRRLVAAIPIILVAAAALALRLPGLDRRPMHNDEANQAVKTGILQETGVYHYDPADHHGPTLYYAALPVARWQAGRSFAGTTEATFRLVPVTFGTLLVLLVLLIADGLGRSAAFWAALLTAASTAMVFYSRYYIQEMLLVCFTFAAVGTGWRWLQTRRFSWCLLCGACVGLMFATKETAVVACGAAAVSLAATYTAAGRPPAIADPGRLAVQAAGGLAAALLVVILFYSSFFTHPDGIADALLAYGAHVRRAGGDSVHVHPWHWYIHMLLFARYGPGPAWTEALVVGLAVVGAGFAWAERKTGPAARLPVFLASYTLLMTVAYSAIPYKTPWNLLMFLHGMILLAGFGAARLVRVVRPLLGRAAVVAVLLAGVVQLGHQSVRSNTRFCADPRNPYVYAHTSTDFLRLVARIHALARVHTHREAMLVAVIAHPHAAWPLPWYLRGFSSVGYWHEADYPAHALTAAVIVASVERFAGIEQQVRTTHQVEFYSVRPEVLVVACIRKDLWQQFLETRE